jgi:hypothetical protein
VIATDRGRIIGSDIPYNLAAFFILFTLFIINMTFLALLSYAWVRGERGTWKLPLKRLG